LGGTLFDTRFMEAFLLVSSLGYGYGLVCFVNAALDRGAGDHRPAIVQSRSVHRGSATLVVSLRSSPEQKQSLRVPRFLEQPAPPIPEPGLPTRAPGGPPRDAGGAGGPRVRGCARAPPAPVPIPPRLDGPAVGPLPRSAPARLPGRGPRRPRRHDGDDGARRG